MKQTRKQAIVLLGALMLVISGALSAYAAPSYEASLVGYWNLDETTGATAYDATVNNHDGAITGATMGSAGVHGTAFSFDGSGDYISIPDSEDWNYGSSDFTISVRINATSTVGYWKPIIGQYSYYGRDGNGYPLIGVFVRESGKVGFWEQSAGSYHSDPYSVSVHLPVPGAADGTWHNVTFTRLSGTLYGYLDGVLAGSISYPNSNNRSTPLEIGKGPDGTPGGVTRYFDGLIDDVAIWNRALDTYEIDSMFTSGVEAFESVLTGTNGLGLGYSTAEINQLMDIYATQNTTGTEVGGITWKYLETLPDQDNYQLGETYMYGGKYYIKLGSGLEGAGGEVPEPSTLLLLLPLLGFGLRRIKRSARL